MIMATRQLLLIERREHALRDCLAGEMILFLIRTVAPENRIRLAERPVVLHERADARIETL